MRANSSPLDELDRINPIGIGLCFIAEISWAAGSIYARRAPLPRSAPLGTGLEMLAGGLVLMLAGGALSLAWFGRFL